MAKNTSGHRVINRTPFEAILGSIKFGLRTTSLLDEILNSLVREEDLEQALEQFQENNSNPEPKK